MARLNAAIEAAIDRAEHAIALYPGASVFIRNCPPDGPMRTLARAAVLAAAEVLAPDERASAQADEAVE